MGLSVTVRVIEPMQYSFSHLPLRGWLPFCSGALRLFVVPVPDDLNQVLFRVETVRQPRSLLLRSPPSHPFDPGLVCLALHLIPLVSVMPIHNASVMPIGIDRVDCFFCLFMTDRLSKCQA